ncbi:hypothetical protein K435DRAFT_853664 [Dendrothele bispora CBS 962.96]|uniref:Uncharacterized protein n=1 Tax=Dendrothele bispora (strain CBS 962.96) TaxID=1314807 RepID=A0A4S8MFV0_DENBC|nr:hypothetical protein K435DRAFT_853664 [Dendrothele bispora CBS 962.96]
MSHLTHGKVDESSKIHSKVASCYSIIPTSRVIIGPQPAIYLAHVNLNSVLFEGFMANGFDAGGQRTATVNGQEDEEPETADTVIVDTGASAKGLGLKDEEAYRQSGISACAVSDGAFGTCTAGKPLVVIGGADSAAKEATCSSCS